MSIYINLHEEPQVDLVIRHMDRLEYLNGLPVEREILDEVDEVEEEDRGEEDQEEEEKEDSIKD